MISGVGPQTKSHVLFPLVDYIVKTVHHNQQWLVRMDSRLKQQEKQLSSMESALKELKELQEKNEVKTFDLKSAGYEVILHKAK